MTCLTDARPSFAQQTAVEGLGANQSQMINSIFIPNLQINPIQTFTASPLQRTPLIRWSGTHEPANSRPFSLSNTSQHALAVSQTETVRKSRMPAHGAPISATFNVAPKPLPDAGKNSTFELAAASVESQVSAWTGAFDPMIKNAWPNGNLGIALRAGIDEYHGTSPMSGDD